MNVSGLTTATRSFIAELEAERCVDAHSMYFLERVWKICILRLSCE